MPTSRRILIALTSLTAAATLALAGCGSDDGGDGATTSADATATSQSAAATSTAPATYTFQGSTGRATITTSGRPNTAPDVQVTTPFAVTTTQVHTLSEGTGATVADGATVTVQYHGVNGRTGATFDSSYTRGEPASFSLDGVIAGFSKAIAGQKVGSVVAVAAAPADGYPQGQPDAGIEGTDTLIFVIEILSAG